MILFTKDLEIGIPHIDLQHKSLLGFINKAASLFATNPSNEEMKECLDFLGSYVVQHFHDEEVLQIESGYPRYQQHKEIHQEFVGTVMSMREEFDKFGSSEELSTIINKRVSNWVITHIRLEDVRFGEHYAQFAKGR